MSGILVHSISDCLQTATDLFEPKNENLSSYGRTDDSCLYLRAHDVNSGPLSVYVYATGKHNSSNS